MKKLIALFMVCGFAFAFAACGGQKSDEAAESESVDTPTEEAVQPAEEDTVMQPADSVEAPADSTSM